MSKHDCVERVNALLKEHNTALMGVITFGDGPERIALATVKADDKLRKKPALFFATYCPMCGVRLEADRATHQEDDK